MMVQQWLLQLGVLIGLTMGMCGLKAHPVIFKGGWVYWGTFTNQHNNQKISYTFHPRFSIELASDFHSQWMPFQLKHPTEKDALKHSTSLSLDASDSFFLLSRYRDYKIGINWLVKRWLLTHSQANLYLSFYTGVYQYSVCDSPYKKSIKKSMWNRFFCDRFQKNNHYKQLFTPTKEILTQFSLSADWESRRFYTLFHYSLTYNSRWLSLYRKKEKTDDKENKNSHHSTQKNQKNVHDFLFEQTGLFMNKALRQNGSYRIGIAPYIAGMDQLQTWLVFQLDSFQRLRVEDHFEISSLLDITKDWKASSILRFFYKNALWEVGSSFDGSFFLTLMIHY